MSGLKGFLDDGEDPPEPVGDTPASEAPPPEPQPEPTAEPPPAEGGEGDEPLPEGHVPVGALAAERRQRQDWKERALKSDGLVQTREAELAALREQLATATKAAQPPPPPPEPVQAVPIPNPIEDPEGFEAYQRHERAKSEFNVRLEITEDQLREKEGDEAVDKAIAAWKVMRADDPTLGRKLWEARNPFRWLFQHVKAVEAAREIGDPEAWKAAEREKMRAEARAEVLAELESGEPAQRAAPPVDIPISIGTERSAAPRSQAAETAPEWADAFKRKRKSS